MKVTPLSVTDYPVSEETYASVVWLLKKYSSIAYIRRCHQLLATFTREYERFAATGAGQFPAAGYREILIRLYRYQAGFERGLSLLRAGDRSGYREAYVASELSDYLSGRATEYGADFEEVGFRPRPETPSGIFAWARRASMMAVNVWRTLGAEWTFERFFVPSIGSPPTLPKPVPPLIRPHQVQIITKDAEVPICGVWQPIDVPKGCPNYLRPGMRAVPVDVPRKRIDDPLAPGEPPERAEVLYEFEPSPTRWQLLWEDNRYRNSAIPGESEYLDPETDFPQDGIQPAPPIT